MKNLITEKLSLNIIPILLGRTPAAIHVHLPSDG